MSRPQTVTGEQLYQEICTAAAKAGQGLAPFARPLFGSGCSASWKLEQLRIARYPQRHTIDRVRALVAGKPIPAGPVHRKGVYDSDLQRMTRIERERRGLPPSRRAIKESALAENAQERRAQLERARDLADLARETRRPGQTVHARLRELQQELEAA